MYKGHDKVAFIHYKVLRIIIGQAVLNMQPLFNFCHVSGFVKNFFILPAAFLYAFVSFT